MLDFKMVEGETSLVVQHLPCIAGMQIQPLISKLGSHMIQLRPDAAK